MGHYVDGVKFAGGSFSLLPEDKLRELIDLAHEHHAYVSTVSITLHGQLATSGINKLY
jgi:phosphosulfolactate synthase (CoM biosynthesis protein A)